MANYFPLIVDAANQQIDELPVGANLDLTSSNLVNAVSITATGNVAAGNISVTGNIVVANLSVSGTLNAGDISVSSIQNGTSNVDIVGTSGNVTVSVGGNANILTVTGTGANIAGTLSVSGNVSLAALNANGTVGNGIVGGALTSGATKGTGVTGQAYVTASADTGAAVGVRGYATDTHSGGYNIGVLGNALGSGVGNYAFYVQNGGIASIENTAVWDLYDNSQTALVWQSTGKANILGIDTTNGYEGVYTEGYLNVLGNAVVGGIKTDNYYYANGSPVDFQQTGGSNTQVQFNNNGNFGGSANFTFDSATNILSVNGNIQGSNLLTSGILSAG